MSASRRSRELTARTLDRNAATLFKALGSSGSVATPYSCRLVRSTLVQRANGWRRRFELVHAGGSIDHPLLPVCITVMVRKYSCTCTLYVRFTSIPPFPIPIPADSLITCNLISDLCETVRVFVRFVSAVSSYTTVVPG